MSRRCLAYENITDYLKNHWTKHRLVCIHFDAFSMLILDMDTLVFNNCKMFDFFFSVQIKASTASWSIKHKQT